MYVTTYDDFLVCADSVTIWQYSIFTFLILKYIFILVLTIPFSFLFALCGIRISLYLVSLAFWVGLISMLSVMDYILYHISFMHLQISIITSYSPPYHNHFNQQSLTNKNFFSCVMCGARALNWPFSYWWQCMAFPDKSKLHQVPQNHVQNGLHHNQPHLDNTFLSGIKQRLLSFIFRRIWNEEKDRTLVGYITLYSILLFSFHSTLCGFSQLGIVSVICEQHWLFLNPFLFLFSCILPGIVK